MTDAERRDDAALLHVRLVEVLTANGVTWEAAHELARALVPVVRLRGLPPAVR